MKLNVTVSQVAPSTLAGELASVRYECRVSPADERDGVGYGCGDTAGEAFDAALQTLTFELAEEGGN
jgi:hypothetical protein